MRRKIILIAIMTLILTMIINIQFVYAGSFDLGNVLTKAGTFVKNGAAADPGTESKISDLIKTLVSTGLAIGTIVAVATGIVIGITTMMNGANGKKELKEALTPYIVAVIVLFGGFTIWSAMVNIMDSIFETGGTGSTTTTTTLPTPAAGSSLGAGYMVVHNTLMSIDSVTQNSDGTYTSNGEKWRNNDSASLLQRNGNVRVIPLSDGNVSISIVSR